MPKEKVPSPVQKRDIAREVAEIFDESAELPATSEKRPIRDRINNPDAVPNIIDDILKKARTQEKSKDKKSEK